MAAALRHLLRPIKQISGLAAAGTPRPPALGLRPRTISSGTNKARAYSAQVDCSGMQYYRHGKMVPIEADPVMAAEQDFDRTLLGIDVILFGANSFLLYLISKQ